MFWDLSLCELWREFEIGKRRKQEEVERDIARAWWTAKLSRADKIPKLTDLLYRGKRQSAREIRGVLHTLAGQFGGSVRRVTT